MYHGLLKNGAPKIAPQAEEWELTSDVASWKEIIKFSFHELTYHVKCKYVNTSSIKCLPVR